MSSVKKKSNSVLPNIEDVRKMTTNSKSDFQQKIDTGVSKAFEKITKDSDKKMREAAAEGRSSARLFNWKYCEDPNDNTYKFNGVRIMDLIKKGDLLEKLRNHFNPTNSSDGYRTGWSEDKKKSNNNPREFYIYVTWAPPKRIEETEETEEKVE